MTASRAATIGLAPARVYGALLEQRSAGLAALACLGSGVAHALIAAAFAALWIAPWQLEEERRGHAPPPPVDAMTWVESEPGADVPVADVSDAPVQAVHAPIAAPAPVTPEAAPPPPEAAGGKARPALVNELVAVRVRPPVPKPQEPAAVENAILEAANGTTTASSMTPSGSGSGDAPSAAAAPAEAREKAPDLAARFTKELPRYAADIESWADADAGESEELAFEITLSETGRVVRPESEPPLPAGPRESALTTSLRRAASALVTKLALPGEPVGAGVLRLKVRAKITDGPQRPAGDEIELAFSYDGATRRGLGTFTLRSGRSVTFVVVVAAVQPDSTATASAATAEPTASARPGATPTTAPPPAPPPPPP